MVYTEMPTGGEARLIWASLRKFGLTPISMSISYRKGKPVYTAIIGDDPTPRLVGWSRLVNEAWLDDPTRFLRVLPPQGPKRRGRRSRQERDASAPVSPTPA